jgi:FkbM family methyltransferase
MDYGMGREQATDWRGDVIQPRIPIRNRIPRSRLKFIGANAVHRVLRAFLGDRRRQVRRRGVTYEIDLAEGIDLALLVLGSFQGHVVRCVAGCRPDAVVFDVGANFGSMALPMARFVPDGKVYAFEPSHYAFGRLQRNLDLNPELARRVVPVQRFLSGHPGDGSAMRAFASWPVDRRRDDAHPVHCGRVKSSQGVRATTVDAFCDERGVARVDFIKIDTEGYELDVLHGARHSLETHRPTVVFELSLYHMRERGVRFEEYDALFKALDYTLTSTRTGRRVASDNYMEEVPLRFTADILARPL